MSRAVSTFELLLLAAAFALAHTQSPLFFSNQNQYLLHGLADGGLGHLHEDWLANTVDPTPLFSHGVAIAYRTLGLWPLQAAFSLLLMSYFLSVWWLVAGIVKQQPTRGQRFAFAALFIAAHAALYRWLSVLVVGIDYPWYFQSGVAGQYVLGPSLQPSAFGFLLVTALAAFVHRRPYLAVLLQSLACLIHSTYLLPAGLLTAGYLFVLVRDGDRRKALGTAVAAIIGIVPTVTLTLAGFSPTSPELFEQSQEILAFLRIPHHTRIRRWLDVVAGLQYACIVLSIVLAWGTRLGPVLAVATMASLVLTGIQWATADATLALFFPWRITAILVPVATAVIAWRLVASRPIPPALLLGFFGPLMAVSVLGGIAVLAVRIGYSENRAELETLRYVRESSRPGEVYLLPSRYPAVGTGRGILSASFTPAPRPDPKSSMIPVDLQRFRLLTGAPIFVDFKSMPYKDTEVLEWKRRMDLNQKWYEEWSREGVKDEVKREGITHVVTARNKPIDAAWLAPIYMDDAYIVYRIR